MGQMFYKSNDYQKERELFNGYANTSLIVSKNQPLPVGTYFYIVNYRDEKGKSYVKKGFLFIK